jgi:hypothetical protein
LAGTQGRELSRRAQEQQDQGQGHGAADGQHLEDGVVRGHALAQGVHEGQAGDAQDHAADAGELVVEGFQAVIIDHRTLGTCRWLRSRWS